ncbi:MAG: hypothetical protein BGO21_02370 [Dyadobacter sp. 50-39]|uniref:DUF2147 domain-containing protein n=1 Tax=Dyadobacter sp. 50-39 TaxID=1895756 RepID=UPI00095FCE90|nr:DUF2147 domain-containing protein [Dyadobacter sp. 50-39]OJV12610.1 MAG: hypothetical protein BGO21_02370 [Dyadobacter sp. 50-39]
MKKKIVATCLLAFSSMLTYAQKATDNLAGKWKTPEGKVVIVSGTPDQGFTGVGQNNDVTVLKDIKFSGSKWIGWIIRPTDGTKVKCEVVIEGDELKITAKKGMFSKELIWKKS